MANRECQATSLRLASMTKTFLFLRMKWYKISINVPVCLHIHSSATIGPLVCVFMDSGMQVNIINSNLFKDKQIHSVMLVDPTRVTTLSGVAGSNVLVRGQIYLASDKLL